MTAFIEALAYSGGSGIGKTLGAAGSAAEAAVQWHQDSPTRIVLHVNAPAAGWLVLADAFYPGWEAHVDGQPTPIYAADGLFRAVAVPPGLHEVTFDFRPRSLRLGGALAAVGVVLAAAALWLAGRGRKPLTTEPLDHRPLVTSHSSKRRRPSARRAARSGASERRRR